MAINLRDDHLERRIERIRGIRLHKRPVKTARELLLSKLDEVERDLGLPPIDVAVAASTEEAYSTSGRQD